MMKLKKPINIPIIEAKSGTVVGGFCTTRDVVSNEEVAALEKLYELQQQARAIKRQLQHTDHAATIARLEQSLEQLRREAALWREKRLQATFAKHVALGHIEDISRET